MPDGFAKGLTEIFMNRKTLEDIGRPRMYYESLGMMLYVFGGCGVFLSECEAH